MSPTPELIQRLALPQHLVREAERLLERTGPYSSGSATSLLQDAAEAFLGVLAEHRRIPVGGGEPFPALLTKVGEKCEGVSDHKAPLTRLNRARVNFKHHGIRVAEEDASSFLNNVRAFLSEISREVLEVDFWSISSIDAVGHRRTQNWLRKAKESFESEEFMGSLECSAKAAAVFLSYRSALPIGLESELFPSSWAKDAWHSRRFRAHGGQDSGFESWASAKIDELEWRLVLVSNGIDLAEYNKFQSLTPRTSMTRAGAFRTLWAGKHMPMAATAQDALFCINFVVNTAIRLQDSTLPAHGSASQDLESLQKVVVDQPCEIVVFPDEPREVIRQAPVGEELTCWRTQDEPSSWVPVLQDFQRAFVRRDRVRFLTLPSERNEGS